MDVRTRETVGVTMGFSTANSRTTDNSITGRRYLPFSVFDTSFQLCPSVHLRVRCKADRSFFTEENLYTGCQEQRRVCARTVASRYFTQNEMIRSCNKRKIMSNVDVMVASFAMPKLHFCGPNENFCYRDLCCKVIPSSFRPVLTFFSSKKALVYNTLDRLLPGLCSFGASCSYPYARFMMACFQQMFRCSAMCTCHCVDCICSQPSIRDSCGCNSTRTTECKQCFSRLSSESETNCVHSGVKNDFNGVSIQHGGVNAIGSSNTQLLSLECSTTVPNHIVTESICDDDDGDAQSLNRQTFRTNYVSTVPCLTTSQAERSSITNENHVKSSFFIRVSHIDSSDWPETDSGDDGDNDNDDATDAASDSESDSWDTDDDDDDDDDDSGWTSCTNVSQCFLADLDPFKINGLYIPQTSNVPVSYSRCHSLPLQPASEIESESERALKRINDTWQQWYNGDGKLKPSSRRQHHTKHVCLFSVIYVILKYLNWDQMRYFICQNNNKQH